MAFPRRPGPPNLLVDPDFNASVRESQATWRHAVSTAQRLGVDKPGQGAVVHTDWKSLAK